MDYTQTDLLFKIKKSLRYVRLYGLSRTFVKIKGQFHMKATASFEGTQWLNTACRNADAAERRIAIIGCGNYSFSNIAYYLKKKGRCFLRCAYDILPNRAVSLCKAYGGLYVPADWHEILTDPQVKIVYIASNHASHAEYAVACIEAGKHVHIEKPHVVSADQLARLAAAMKAHPEVKVFLGFNRPRSRLFLQLQQILTKEAGPLMINWFVAGHEIPDDHWYFDEKEGGRVLGNLCHWTDLTLQLVSLDRAFPCTIVPAAPVGAKSDFMVSVIFADRSCAAITFSAKGHTFEGVREVVNIHKGDVLANLTDFQTLRIELVEKKRRTSLLHRDHGHGANIFHSLAGVDTATPGEAIPYVNATARLFLAIRQAIDSGQPVFLSREEALGAACGAAIVAVPGGIAADHTVG